MSEAYKIAFIGTGNMAGAIIKGLKPDTLSDIQVALYDIDAAKAEALTAEVGGAVADSLEAAVLFADLLVLSVKPQNTVDLLKAIAPSVQENQLVVSVAAGVTLATYEEHLPNAAIARAMPNTSSAVLAGITGLMAGTGINDQHKSRLEQLFNAVGETIWIDEADIHSLIAVSGSGPAYFYYFTELMATVGEEMGLKPEVAAKLARATAIGAGKMLEAKTETPAELRLQVTSPNGTTAKAIEVFSQELPPVMAHAMGECAKRSQELA